MSKERSTKAFEKELTVFDRTAIQSFANFEEADEADRVYWQSRTPTERLIALEHIRQLAWGYDDETQPKLSGSPDLLKLRQRKIRRARRVREDLKANKLASGRTKDLADVESLTKLCPSNPKEPPSKRRKPRR